MASHTQTKRSPITRYFRDWYTNTSSDLGLRLGIRILQFALALTIMVLYSRDLRTFTAFNSRAPAAWVYAEVVAALSIIICLWCTFVNVKHRVLRLLLDFGIAVLWAAQAGYFGTLYIQADSVKDRPPEASERRMRAAVWIGVGCVALWLLSFFQSLVWRCQALKKKVSAWKKEQRAEKGTAQERVEVLLRDEEEQMSMQTAVQSLAVTPDVIEVKTEEQLPAYEETEGSKGWMEEKRKQEEVVQQLGRV